MADYTQESAIVSEGRRLAGILNDAVYASASLAKRVSALGSARVVDYLTQLADGPCTPAEWNQAIASMESIAAWIDAEQHDRKLEKIR
jgi:hypothetical protein